jgi:hypothetical protein
MVNKAYALKKEPNILAESAKNLGETLSEETVQKVKVFMKMV